MTNSIRIFFALVLFLSVGSLSAQKKVIPHWDVPQTEVEDQAVDYRSVLGAQITDPPAFPVRTMAEWEEIQSLVITWAGFSAILKQIAFHAKQECEVIIIAENANTVISYLNSNNGGGAAFENLDNITIIEDGFDSIWGRDYGAHTIYRDDVDELLLVDWIYNRNRPADDNVPITVAEHVGVPLYSTSEPPYDLMATGGNFMTDGMGTAFSSELIVEENTGGSTWWTQFPDHTVTEIEDILEQFMGIDRYVMMDVLPYDAIHHIDMHMKLLDEETIVIGEYPDGVADGPQIEANLEYILSNYNSPFGTPYDILRLQMPPEGGAYPNSNADYRTYTNMVFVNKTVLVPIYEETYDTPALEIIQEALPGYNVVGIECNDIIPLSGAIHCITKAVGVDDPLLIIHDPLDDTYDAVNDYAVAATVKHVSDILSATLHYKVDGGSWLSSGMNLTSAPDDQWTGYIPAQSVGSVIEYYVEGVANSGKQMVRPIVAPEGSWTFEVLGNSTGLDDFLAEGLNTEVYPNPAHAITAIQVDLPVQHDMRITLDDMLGRSVHVIFDGSAPAGEQRYFFNAEGIATGAYNVRIQLGDQVHSERLMIR